MTKYLIIGCSGSGKSTLARNPSNKLSISYYDTDSLYWQKDWQLQDEITVINQLPLESESWIIDGNFENNRDLIWSNADKIVWLNLNPFLILYRVIARNLSWFLRQKPTWSGNKMTLKIALSGIRHSFKQVFKTKKNFPKYLEEYSNQEIVELRNKQDITNFLISSTNNLA